MNVDSADDALHANDVTVSGGTLTLASGDDAVHADNDLVVGVQGSSSTSNPKIDITASYEGLEGTTVSVYSGDIDVAASDDGVNAANSDLGERSENTPSISQAATFILTPARTAWTRTTTSL